MKPVTPTNGGEQPRLLTRLARAVRADGWQNVLTGLGTATRDKAEATEFLPGATLSAARLEALYREDDMAARICDTLPQEMLRKGFEVGIESSEGVPTDKVHGIEADILTATRDLEVIPKVVEAAVWGRLFGGGAIFLGANDGAGRDDMGEPLNESGIATVESLTVLDRQYLTVKDWYNDPSEPLYGEPKTYTMTASTAAATGQNQLVVHHTRLVTFYGTRPTIQRRQELEGWSDSVLQRVNRVLRDFHTGWQATGHLFTDAAQSVFKVKGLIDQIAAGNTTTIQARMRLVDMNRSVARAIAIDADGESFERQPYNFGNVDKILDKFMLRLAAAARIPVTILMGQAPSGMDSTGESDIRWFYDSIAAERETVLLPKLERILTVIMLAKDGPTKGVLPENWSIRFPSLWEPTRKEESEIRKTVADADKVYYEMGALLAEEIALSRFPATGYSIDTTIDTELREAALQAEIDAAEAALAEDDKPADPPDPVPPPPPPADPDPPPADPNAPPPPDPPPAEG